MNGITMWRLDPGFYGRNPSKAHVVTTCTNRAKSKRSDSGQTMAKQGQTTNQGLEGLTAAAKDAANADPAGKGLPPVHLWNSAVLRRSRHANRRRWYVVLHGDANRPAGAGAAVFDDPQARGRQALSRDAGGEGRHPRRRCAVSRGRDAEGERRHGAGCCASAPMSTTGWLAIPRTGCGSRRPPTAA